MSYLEELLPEFRKGAKIRKNYWNKDSYICYKNGMIYDNKNEPVYKFTTDSIISDDWEIYQEPIDWDYIIKNKCLCWFYAEQVVYDTLGHLIDKYDTDKPFAMIDMFGKKRYFANCRPVRRDEVTFYEDRKDERL